MPYRCSGSAVVAVIDRKQSAGADDSRRAVFGGLRLSFNFALFTVNLANIFAKAVNKRCMSVCLIFTGKVVNIYFEN